MLKLAGAIAGLSMMLIGEVSAAPLLAQATTPHASPPLEQVKVICDQQGRCYRPPVRRPIARWVYGDGNFYGPYDGPGYYGDPRLRYRVFPYFWW
ncbi:hypothetical protein [Bradyrhizobium sp. AS23.2]|uniref:hypothetical protein n=1 Tax=Bradyrhizobium sp. AS23.2 TaxID=1680155 RepID=UPI000939F6B8|nr:hypothetical protein [Bradyrhizobium sp. AS23.2]OKO86829.1 hypothetical protein AC630_01930 [Bradyrhizobium sp. AS23.2]